MPDSTQQPARSHTQPKKGKRRKTKSGCRTCKTRKVKCDEDWPACRKCVSTGRVCDGYGIWGGGGNRYEQRRPAGGTAESSKIVGCSESARMLLQKNVFSSTVPVKSTEEHLHFAFFKDETLSKLPGVYGRKYNNVWEALVLQACAEEPAVLHAVLAISSAHRRKVHDGVSRSWVQAHPDREEKFLLHNYSKSIFYLQPRYHLSGEHSLRVTLITCLVFIYLELLRGNYTRACNHLSSGVDLLRSLHSETSTRRTWARISSFSSSPPLFQSRVDTFLTEAFARLRVQTTFCNHRRGTGSSMIPCSLSTLPLIKFGSYHEARHYLDLIIEGVTRLTQAIRDETHTTWPPAYWGTLRTEQRLMQGSLDSWLWSYDATLADVSATDADDDGNRYTILRVYHAMADIMAATCLSPGQSAFDNFSAQFLDIVTRSEDIASSSDPGIAYPLTGVENAGTGPRTTRAWPDVSWIPPLYFTALKCRVRDIRTRAVELMAAFSRFEIIWDVGILDRASLVAREVIRMEHGDGCEEVGVVPLERRFDAVDMVLDDEGVGRVQIVCKRFKKGGVEVVKKVYDEGEGVWMKVEG